MSKLNAAENSSFSGRCLAAFGAVLAAVAVGLGAYASHGVDGETQKQLAIAALFAFGHGLALAALARQAFRQPATLALFAIGLGTLLFSGSHVGTALLETSTAAAPLGGMLMMAGWVLWAIAALRPPAS